MVWGGVTARPGTIFVGEVKDSTKIVRIIPFQFSDLVSYHLIFNGGVVQFVKQDKTFVMSGGVRYEKTHPYSDAQLAEITFAQQSNVLYLAHQGIHPQQLVNNGADTNWSSMIDIPFVNRALTDTKFISAYVNFKILQGVNVFKANSPKTTWTFTTDGSGVITVGPTLNNPAGADGLMIEVTVDAGLDVAGVWTVELVLTQNAAAPTRQEWTVTRFDGVKPIAEWAPADYPGAVGLFEQRLWWAGSKNRAQTLVGSKAGDANYQTVSLGPNDDDAISLAIATGGYDRIRHLEGTTALLAFTTNNAYTVSGSGGFGITPSSFLIQRNTNYGSRNVRPITVANETIYITRDKYIRSTSPGATTSPELSILSEHLVRQGGGLVDVAFAQDPDSIIWYIRADGVMVSLTILREQQVVALAHHETGSAGSADLFENVSSIGSQTFDQVAVCVRRSINGTTKRYIEILDYDTQVNGINKITMDSALVATDGTAKDTWTGLGHLEAETLDIVTNTTAYSGDEVANQKVVASSQVVLDEKVNGIKAGIPFVPTIELLNPETDPRNSTRSQQLNVFLVTAIMHETLGLTLEFTDEKGNLVNSEDIVFLEGGALLDQPLAVYTGQKTIVGGGGWVTPYTLTLKQNLPMPWTILSLVLDLTINER